jgi:ribonuclease HI
VYKKIGTIKTIEKYKAPNFIQHFSIQNIIPWLTIKRNEVWIWTDGSAKKLNKPIAAWAVYFGKDSPLNFSSTVNDNHNCFEAELEVIEYVINNSPPSMKLRIFTDSQSAITFIDNRYKMFESGKINKSSARFVLRRIDSLLKNRTESCSFYYVPSHIEEKLKHYESDWPKLHSLIEKLKQLETEFPEDFLEIIEGN